MIHSPLCTCAYCAACRRNQEASKQNMEAYQIHSPLCTCAYCASKHQANESNQSRGTISQVKARQIVRRIQSGEPIHQSNAPTFQEAIEERIKQCGGNLDKIAEQVNRYSYENQIAEQVNRYSYENQIVAASNVSSWGPIAKRMFPDQPTQAQWLDELNKVPTDVPTDVTTDVPTYQCGTENSVEINGVKITEEEWIKEELARTADRTENLTIDRILEDPKLMKVLTKVWNQMEPERIALDLLGEPELCEACGSHQCLFMCVNSVFVKRKNE